MKYIKTKKDDVVPVYATKVSTQGSGIAPLILNLVFWAYSRNCLDYFLSVGKRTPVTQPSSPPA
jgi:hypothetical protein